MNIVRVVIELVQGLLGEAVEFFILPIFGFISMISLSPEILENMAFINLVHSAGLGIGAALFLLLTMWSGIKAMGVGVGVASDEPIVIITKAFIAGFLVFFIKNILLYFVGQGALITSNIINLLRGDISWNFVLNMLNPLSGGLIYILGIVLIFQCIKLAWNMFVRLAMVGVLVSVSPIAAACVVSKTVEGFWQGFVKLFIGNIIIQILQSVCVVAVFASIGSINFGIGITIPPQEIFTIFLVCGFMSVANKLEDVVRDMSINAGIGRDMQGAVSRLQSGAFAASSVSNLMRR